MTFSHFPAPVCFPQQVDPTLFLNLFYCARIQKNGSTAYVNCHQGTCQILLSNPSSVQLRSLYWQLAVQAVSVLSLYLLSCMGSQGLAHTAKARDNEVRKP